MRWVPAADDLARRAPRGRPLQVEARLPYRREETDMDASIFKVDTAIAEASAPVVELVDLIRTQYREVRMVPPLDPADGYLRSSGLYRLCPREEVLRRREGVVRYDGVSADQKLTFEHGNGIHHAIQNGVLPDVGALVGVWACLRCGCHAGSYARAFAGVVLRPDRCSGCQAQEFRYVELACQTPDGRLRGHVDGLVYVPDPSGRPFSPLEDKLYVLEVKSVKADLFPEAKRRVFGYHFLQVQAYMLLSGLNEARVLYWNKAKDAVAGLAEHAVKAHPPTQQAILAAVTATFDALARDELPPRVLCQDAACARAQACPVRGSCFAEALAPEEDPCW